MTKHRPESAFWGRHQTSRLKALLVELALAAVGDSGDWLWSSEAGTERT